MFSESLAFNLLMGRRWPPRPEDLELAETVCRRLGLGDLLDRMPGGLFQLVGETGWQLSHGERSRLFMARALLQGADLVVLDESFAELDPESFGTAWRKSTSSQERSWLSHTHDGRTTFPIDFPNLFNVQYDARVDEPARARGNRRPGAC